MEKERGGWPCQRIADIPSRTSSKSRGYIRKLSHPRPELSRAAYEIVARQGDSHATAEQLPPAMVYYRSLFDELLEPAKDEFPEPAWVGLYAPPKDELLKPAKDELLEPAKIEAIGRKGRKVTRDVRPDGHGG